MTYWNPFHDLTKWEETDLDNFCNNLFSDIEDVRYFRMHAKISFKSTLNFEILTYPLKMHKMLSRNVYVRKTLYWVKINEFHSFLSKYPSIW